MKLGTYSGVIWIAAWIGGGLVTKAIEHDAWLSAGLIIVAFSLAASMIPRPHVV